MKLDNDKLLLMLEMQEEMNSEINPDWKRAENDWSLAILVETIELIEHIGWKWWKKPTTNMIQAQMELVDIWHFMLSSNLERFGSDAQIWLSGDIIQATDRYFLDDEMYVISELCLLSKLKLLAGIYASKRFASMELVEAIMTDLGMTWDDLYLMYVGKNTLNIFRQRHGYGLKNESVYIKDWDGMEDNEYLTNILKTVDTNPDTICLSIYKELEDKYKAVKLLNID